MAIHPCLWIYVVCWAADPPTWHRFLIRQHLDPWQCPSARGTSSVTSARSTPSVPSAPGTPSVPSAPGTPSVPSAPGTSSVPSATGTSSVPSARPDWRLPELSTQQPPGFVDGEDKTSPSRLITELLHCLFIWRAKPKRRPASAPNNIFHIISSGVCLTPSYFRASHHWKPSRWITAIGGIAKCSPASSSVEDYDKRQKNMLRTLDE